MAYDKSTMWSGYHRLVRLLIPRLYQQVSAGRYWIVLVLCSSKVHTHTPGDSALGGDRHTRESYRRWWQRIFRLNAALDLQVHSVTVYGPPWNTTVHTEWTDHVTAHDGTVFTNHGAHHGHIRWGRITNLDYAWDEDAVRRACEHHAHLGLPEATALPIRDQPEARFGMPGDSGRRRA